MTMLLNCFYRCVWTDGDGNDRISFNADVITHGHWREVIEKLKYKQRNWPERKYRLQVWDEGECQYKDYPLINSKYALFSED